MGYSTLAWAALADGDVAAARSASEAAWQYLRYQSQTAATHRAYNAEAALATGDLDGTPRQKYSGTPGRDSAR
jgi:hypothetical protein